MKIALFHNLSIGGALRVVEAQARYLETKHKVKIFRLNDNLQGNRLKKDFNNFVSLAKKHKLLAQKIDDQNFDVVLAHPDKLTQASFLLRYLKTPSVYFCQELLRIAYEPELAFKGSAINELYENTTRLIRKRIDRKNAQSTDLIITASRYIKGKVKVAYNKRAQVVNLGVDTKVFKPGLKKTNQLLFVGAKNKFEGYDLAHEIAKKTATKLKVISGFKITDNELAKEYSKSIATLCLQHSEPFGLVALESMACETPVLAVNEGGYKETVVNNKTGYLLPRNVRKFVRIVDNLVLVRNVANKLGWAGRKHVQQNFSWKHHNRTLEGHLEKIV